MRLTPLVNGPRVMDSHASSPFLLAPSLVVAPVEMKVLKNHFQKNYFMRYRRAGRLQKATLPNNERTRPSRLRVGVFSSCCFSSSLPESPRRYSYSPCRKSTCFLNSVTVAIRFPTGETIADLN